MKTLEASNGVIYIIDKVLIPEPESNIVQVLTKKGSFSTLITALNVAGLTSTVESGNSLIFFLFRASSNEILVDFFIISWSIYSIRSY